ncbi:MAG: hypothetical protein HY514_00380 [Candidatus Aenigmarchaeota archaeon]|nr:hypothetical protein [Candidatus Aenigmarchaeota archaeon]
MLKTRKGIALTTETLTIVVFAVIGFVFFLLIYVTVTSDAPGPINTLINRILDSILGFFA